MMNHIIDLDDWLTLEEYRHVELDGDTLIVNGEHELCIEDVMFGVNWAVITDVKLVHGMLWIEYEEDDYELDG